MKAKRIDWKKIAAILRDRFLGAEVSITSVVIAYYLLLSLFPMAIALGNLLPLLQIDIDVLMAYMALVVPAPILSVLEPIFRDLLSTSSGGLISIGALAALWSSSKGVRFMQKGMNKAYGIPDTSSFIAKRVVSLVTIVLVLLFFAVFVLFFSVGELLLGAMGDVFTWASQLAQIVSDWKWPVAIAFIFCMMLLMLRVTPDVKLRLRDAAPGAAFSTLALLAVAQGFTLYVRFSTRSFSGYGTLSTFFVMMFWLQLSAMIVILGAVLNATISEYRFGKAQPDDSRLDRAISDTRQSLGARLRQFLQNRKK